MFDSVKFGACLSRFRKKADLTQSELAARIGVTKEAVSSYERGESFPDVATLVAAARALGVSIDELCGATEGEARVIESSEGEVKGAVNAGDVVKLAPYLRPSVLDKLAAGLAKQGIDISRVVELAEYLSDEATMKLLETATFDTIDETLLRKLIPFLDEKSKGIIFDKILAGELDYHYIEIILPYAEYLIPYVESAVIDGAIDDAALEILRNYIANRPEDDD